MRGLRQRKHLGKGTRVVERYGKEYDDWVEKICEEDYKERFPEEAEEEGYISVGWIILDQKGKPFKPPAAGHRGNPIRVPPRIYISAAKAKSIAKRFGVKDYNVAEVFYDTLAIKPLEAIDCIHWPNCDVVGCH